MAFLLKALDAFSSSQVKITKLKLMETQIFHLAKISSSKKDPLKETKILQHIITLL
jgi:hypothetical protein